MVNVFSKRSKYGKESFVVKYGIYFFNDCVSFSSLEKWKLYKSQVYPFKVILLCNRKDFS